MLLTSAISAIAAGCTGSKSSGLNQAISLFQASVADSSFTTADVERIKFATIGVRLDNGPEALVGLATSSDRELLWISADRIFLFTRRGRLIRLRNSDHDIIGGDDDKTDPIAGGRLAASGGGPCLRLFDFPRARLFSVLVRSEIREEARASVSMLYGAVEARHFIEIGTSKTLNWEFQNEFYLDPSSGKVIRSIQHISPDMPQLDIRILRPFDGPAA